MKFIQTLAILLFVGILNISAFPAPQDDESLSTEDLNDGTEDPSLLHETIDEVNSDDDGANKDDSETNTDESSSKETSNDETESSSGKPVVEPEVSDTDEQIDVEVNSNSEESDSEEQLTDEDTDIGDYQSDGPSGNDADHSVVLEVLRAYGKQLRIVEETKGTGKRLCQVLVGENEVVLEKECAPLKPQHLVFVYKKFITTASGTDEYTCQELVLTTEGVVQQLCITHDGWVLNPETRDENHIILW